MELSAVCHSHPETLGGALVFHGTRVPVRSLLDHLSAGESIEDFLEGFPSVRREQVLALLKVFAELLRRCAAQASTSPYGTSGVKSSRLLVAKAA